MLRVNGLADIDPGRALVVHSGYSVACLDADGWIAGGRHGLYDFDTRLVSRYRLTIGRRTPTLVSLAQPESDRLDLVFRLPREGGSPEGPMLPQDAVEVLVRRRVGPGMIDEVSIRNHSAIRCDSEIAIEVDGDFADVAEAGRQPAALGRVDRTWVGEDPSLVFRCLAERNGRRFDRALRIRVVESTSPPEPTDIGLRFRASLDAGDEWSVAVRFESGVDGAWRFPALDGDRRPRQRAAWRARRPTLDGPERLRTTFERAAEDLFALRNWELEDEYLGEPDGSAWITNAGVPAFTGFFGRDALTAGWQSLMLGPRAVLGALEVVAATRATADDPWRDAEPGKMIHEMRRGPVAALGLDPRDAYYGTQTTPAMFVLALSEAWHWTGDEAVLRRHRDAALAGLEWADRYGDADGDGFLEYERRSPRGLRNQGWKDSDEAIRHPDGRIVESPVATVEEQAFHFVALQRMAEICVALEEGDRADELLRSADRLRRRWHEAFWMPEERYYALALDGSKRQVRTITSNPGHALGAGIVPAEHARDVADRLLSDELCSGWGIRTLSARHPSYNPFAYHLGAVWPVEQATFALGMKRYGLDAHADRLVGAVLDAAERCPDRRLPEALSGHDRAMVSRPVFYPDANSPQAWSSSALVQLVQVMLGIYPFAPLSVVGLVRPRLPEWLPEVTLRRLRVGRASIDLRFTRQADGSARHRVVRRRGRIAVVTAGPPGAGDDGLDLVERVKRAALERFPGRRARAARIAFDLESPGASDLVTGGEQ